MPTLVAVGTKDDIAGSPQELAALMPNGRGLDIPDRDHMVAVGDKVFKAEAIKFLQVVHEVLAAMKHLQPATAIFKGAAGNRLVADVYGDAGQPVLLLHGGGQTRHAWRRTAEHLGRSGAIAYTLDLRGHGDSEWVTGGHYAFTDFAADAAAVAATLTARGGKRPIAIGASLGGIASLLAEGEADKAGTVRSSPRSCWSTLRRA